MNETRVIRIFEDRQKKLCLSEQEEKDILSMKSIIGENNLNLQADGKLIISHYVGFIQINKTRLLIYPKIAIRMNEQDDFDKAFGILIKLLSYSGFVNVKRIPSPQMVGRYKGDLLEIFISYFIDELLFLFKSDVNRGYNSNLENQSFIKGKIDFTETIKRNSFRQHLHYVRFDQFTEDILLNRIFKTVIQNLITKTLVTENKLKLKQGLLWLESVKPIQLYNDIWKQVKFSRLNSCYEPVFNLAKLFYFNSSPNLNKGDELTFSFLVPLNQLFERYMYEILNNSINSPFEVKYQGPIEYLAELEGKKYMQLRPDISIIKEKRVIKIIDAKYKEVIDNNGDMLVNQSDIYQMLAYGVRYNCNEIILAYPKLLKETNEDVVISEVKIPYNEDYIQIKLVQIDLEEDTKKLYEQLYATMWEGRSR